MKYFSLERKDSISGFLIVCIVLAVFSYTPFSASATPWTPTAWQNDGKLRNWPGDKNGNFIDDRIESQSGPVHIIVVLNGCIPKIETSSLVNFLRTIGHVDYIGKYVTFIVVKGVAVERMSDIANRPEVAMVELDATHNWSNQNFAALKAETSSSYAPNTLHDVFGWPNTLNGRGIKIAFLDSGVGPAYDSQFTHGYNALTGIDENPMPTPNQYDHATEMASWVFGPNGLAPQASLIDIKVGARPDGSVHDDDILKGLEKVFEKSTVWGVDIVALMFAPNRNSPVDNGLDTISAEINLLSSVGVHVVANAGPNACGEAIDKPITVPGAASGAITVSAADIHNTINRADDSATFIRGPRASNGDQDLLNELKPEVIMPTAGDDTCPSNSIAVAQTSALSALILQQQPILGSLDFGNLRDLLIRTAEPRGAPDTTINFPNSMPTWNQYWGFGEIDAFKGFDFLTGLVGLQAGRTDLTFKGFDNSPHCAFPCDSHAIETQSLRSGNNITPQVPDVIFTRIINNGPEDAHNVRVEFGFYPLTNGMVLHFNDLGSKIIPLIPAGGETIVQMPWIPVILAAGQEYGAIRVSIDYGYDTEFFPTSNWDVRVFRIAQTSSPAEFNFRVENPLTIDARIDLKVNTTAYRNWNVKLNETTFNMTATECAKTVHAEIQPPVDTKPGTEATFFVTASATPVGQKQSIKTGGVSLIVHHVPSKYQ